MMKRNKYLLFILVLMVMCVPILTVNAAKKKDDKGTVKMWSAYDQTSDTEPTTYLRAIWDKNGNVKVEGRSDQDPNKKVSVSKKLTDELKKKNNIGKIYILKTTTVDKKQTTSCPGGTSGTCESSNTTVTFTYVTKDECKKKNNESNGNGISYLCSTSAKSSLSYNRIATKKYAQENGYKAGNNSISYEQVNDCEGMLSVELLKLLRKYYKAIILVVIVALAMFGFLDFSKAVTSDSDDGFKKAFSTFSKRVVIAVVIFLLPFILSVFLGIMESASGDNYGIKCITGFGTYKK